MIRLNSVILWTNGEYEGVSRTAFSTAAARGMVEAYARTKEAGRFRILSKTDYARLSAKTKNEIGKDWSIDQMRHG